MKKSAQNIGFYVAYRCTTYEWATNYRLLHVLGAACAELWSTARFWNWRAPL